jgi:hypothetical protein
MSDFINFLSHESINFGYKPTQAAEDRLEKRDLFGKGLPALISEKKVDRQGFVHILTLV